MDTTPTTHLDARYGDAEEAVPWETARERFAGADLYWVTTVRPDGRPHMTPLLSVWHDGAAHFCTGPGEQKERNLASSPLCSLTVTRDVQDGLQVTVEGEARRVTDPAGLAALAALWPRKYGEEWAFEPADGGFAHASEEGGDGAHLAYVFAVAPVTAYAFGTGPVYSQTRYRFPAA